jgi:hypothetical protein
MCSSLFTQDSSGTEGGVWVPWSVSGSRVSQVHAGNGMCTEGRLLLIPPSNKVPSRGGRVNCANPQVRVLKG